MNNRAPKSALGKLSLRMMAVVCVLATSLNAHANSPRCSELFSSESDSIVNQRVEKSNFIVNRNLMDYIGGLDLRTLQTLSWHDHVLDLGAGTLKASIDFATRRFAKFEERYDLTHHSYDQIRTFFRDLNRESLPHVTAVTMVKREGALGPDKNGVPDQAFSTPGLTPLLGRYFEEIPNAELMAQHGKFAFVMDYFGVLTYTKRLDLAGKKLAEVMRPGATVTFFTHNGGSVASVLEGLSHYSTAGYLVVSGAFRYGAESGKSGTTYTLERTDKEWTTPKFIGRQSDVPLIRN